VKRSILHLAAAAALLTPSGAAAHASRAGTSVGLLTGGLALTPTWYLRGISDPPDPAFTINRVRLYVIAARTGEERILLPPLPGDHPDEVMNEVVDSTNRAVERIRKRYPMTDLQVVGLSQYLLQARPAKGGTYTYQLTPEPGAISYSSDAFRGELIADTKDGQLEMDLRVFQDRVSLFQVSLLLDPGRTLVLGQRLPDGGALFAVLTLESPHASGTRTSQRAASRIQTAQSGSPRETASAQETASQEPQVDPDAVYTRWDEAPRLRSYADPDYPVIARKAGVEGRVTMHLIVGIDGKVEDVRVVRADPRLIFDEAARAAVLKWRYEPARIGDRPVRAMVSQTVQFTLGGG
jgi:TonB family protein